MVPRATALGGVPRGSAPRSGSGVKPRCFPGSPLTATPLRPNDPHGDGSENASDPAGDGPDLHRSELYRHSSGPRSTMGTVPRRVLRTPDPGLHGSHPVTPANAGDSGTRVLLP